jgi:hypothetical protein
VNLAHYLPKTEERIERLRQIIKGRPVAIILQGFSARELEERIAELQDCDICYSSLNSFGVIEKYILQKIGHNCSIVMVSGPVGIDVEIENVINFLERPEDNMFISTRICFDLTGHHKMPMPHWFNAEEFIAKYNKRLLFNDLVFPVFHHLAGAFFEQFPSEEFPLHFVAQNSLSYFLAMVLIGKPSRVIIFGADGGRISPDGLYFKETELRSYRHDLGGDIEGGLMADTMTFNQRMVPMLWKIYRIFGLEPVEIINCSERSHYTPFKKLSYDETFSLLKGE